MVFKNSEIKKILEQGNLFELEFSDIVNKSISKVLSIDNCILVKNNEVIASVYHNDMIINTRTYMLRKEQINKISKEILIRLNKYVVSKEFFTFFKTDRFYKAIPKSINAKQIELEIINNDKSPLYTFLIPVSDLNLSSIQKIKSKEFFKKSNILYVSIQRFNKNNNIVTCTQFSEIILKNLFTEILFFIQNRLKTNYELLKIEVEYDKKLKIISFFPTFKNDRKINGNFRSFLHRLLEKKLGKIKINIKYSKKN